MLRAPKKPSDTAYSTSMIMYGSSPIHISSCLRGIPTHELSVNLSRVPSSLRTTIVIRSVAVIWPDLTRSPTGRPPRRAQPVAHLLDHQRGAIAAAAGGLRGEHLDRRQLDAAEPAQLARRDGGRRGDIGQHREQETGAADL